MTKEDIDKFNKDLQRIQVEQQLIDKDNDNVAYKTISYKSLKRGEDFNKWKTSSMHTHVNTDQKYILIAQDEKTFLKESCCYLCEEEGFKLWMEHEDNPLFRSIKGNDNISRLFENVNFDSPVENYRITFINKYGNTHSASFDPDGTISREVDFYLSPEGFDKDVMKLREAKGYNPEDEHIEPADNMFVKRGKKSRGGRING